MSFNLDNVVNDKKREQGTKYGEITENNNEARESITIKKGINKEKGRLILKIIKNSKLKLQASIQGEQVRVSGKKRDDLQNAISELKEAKFDIPLQYINFRD